ncbi:cyclodeaminase/cyclohydrolase family protein, partial [bacterium]|nr:cyclodeaminase/cyclohydrolase family protein [bacterium]
RSTELEKIKRKNALSEASKKANEAPFDVCERAIKLLRLFKDSLSKINPNAITDWTVGAQQAYSALEGAAMNVKINCKTILDKRYETEACQRLRLFLGEGRSLIGEILNQVHSRLDESN